MYKCKAKDLQLCSRAVMEVCLRSPRAAVLKCREKSFQWLVGWVGKKGPFCFPMAAIAESGRRWRSQCCEHGGACDRNSKPAEDGERSGSVNSPDCFITRLTWRSLHVTRRTDTVFCWHKRVSADIFRGVFVVLFSQHAFSV